MGLELLPLLFFIFIAGAAISMLLFSILFIFVISPYAEKQKLSKQYPVKVPGWGMRLDSHPKMNATVEDVAKGLQIFLDECVKTKGYSKRKLKKKLNGLYVKWILVNNEDGGRYLLENGQRTAGDHSGDFIRVMVLTDDKLNDTAFFHELGHEAHELENLADYKHEDKVMWNQVVYNSKVTFAS